MKKWLSPKSSPVNLPPELLREIFLRLPVVEILHCKLVCRQWHKVVKEVVKVASQQWIELDQCEENLRNVADDLRTVFKYEIKRLSYDRWHDSRKNHKNCERWWSGGIGRTLTHLNFDRCSLDTDHLVTILRCVSTSLCSLAVIECRIQDSGNVVTDSDLVTFRERLSGVRRFAFRPIFGSIEITCWFLGVVSTVLDMDAVERVRLDLCPLRYVDSRHFADLCPIVDRFRNVSLSLWLEVSSRNVDAVMLLEHVTICELELWWATYSDAVLNGLWRHASRLRALHVSAAESWMNADDDKRMIIAIMKLFPEFTELERFSVQGIDDDTDLQDTVVSQVLAATHLTKLTSFGVGGRFRDGPDYFDMTRSDFITKDPTNLAQKDVVSSVAARLTTLKLSIDPTRLIFKRLFEMEQLTVLHLNSAVSAAIDDQVIQMVFEHFLELRELKIAQCPVTDVGLTGHPATERPNATSSDHGISRLRKLTILELDLTAITDRSVQQMSLPRLRSFSLHMSEAITVAAFDDLFLRSPNMDCLSINDKCFQGRLIEDDLIALIKRYKPQLNRLKINAFKLTSNLLKAVGKYIPGLRMFNCVSHIRYINAKDVSQLKSKRPYLILSLER